MDEVRDNPEALASQLLSTRGLIVFDGAADAGKTCLAREMVRRLGGEAIDVDQFLDRNLGCFVKAIHFDELRRAVLGALGQSSQVFISTVCARDVVAHLGVPATVHVYVKKHSTMGIPADLEILDAETGSPEALAERCSLSDLDKEIFDYHAKFKPWRNADIVYVRTAD